MGVYIASWSVFARDRSNFLHMHAWHLYLSGQLCISMTYPDEVAIAHNFLRPFLYRYWYNIHRS